jgi:ion channel
MSARRAKVPRFWLSDWSLSALLALLVLDMFVLGPLNQFQAAPAVLSPIVRSLFLLLGIATVLWSRAATPIVGVLGVSDAVVRWMNHFHARVALERADSALTLAVCAVLATVILARVFSPGRINLYRIQGAVAVYLLFALAWAFAYKLVALADPEAFSFPSAGMHSERLIARLLYFSAITLTTVGYGDVTAVNPIARSLAVLEGFVGQLYPAIMLARLVAMELYNRQQGGE